MNSDVTLNITEFLLQIITAVLIFVSVLFSFFLITVRTNNKLSNTLLASYLLIGSIDISSYFYNTYFDVHPIIDMLRHDIAGFLERPLLYLFVISILSVYVIGAKEGFVQYEVAAETRFPPDGNWFPGFTKIFDGFIR